MAIHSTPTLHNPRPTRNEHAALNLEFSARVHYMLLVSRFAHYFKAILRAETGSYARPDDIRNKLADWVKNYVDLDPDSGSGEGDDLASTAALPLRGYDLEVTEYPGRPGQPGKYRAILKLQPHYQIEDPNVRLRVQVELGV